MRQVGANLAKDGKKLSWFAVASVVQGPAQLAFGLCYFQFFILPSSELFQR